MFHKYWVEKTFRLASKTKENAQGLFFSSGKKEETSLKKRKFIGKKRGQKGTALEPMGRGEEDWKQYHHREKPANRMFGKTDKGERFPLSEGGTRGMGGRTSTMEKKQNKESTPIAIQEKKKKKTCVKGSSLKKTWGKKKKVAIRRGKERSPIREESASMEDREEKPTTNYGRKSVPMTMRVFWEGGSGKAPREASHGPIKSGGGGKSGFRWKKFCNARSFRLWGMEKKRNCTI